jgi:hypothetical protein
MHFATKVIIIIAILYNASLGYFVTLSFDPLIVLLFLSVDIFLIFYYVMLLIRYNYGIVKYGKEHMELIEDARSELRRYSKSKQQQGQ